MSTPIPVRLALLVTLILIGAAGCSGAAQTTAPDPAALEGGPEGDTSDGASVQLDDASLGGLRIAAYLPSTAPLVIEIAEVEAFVADVELERFAVDYPSVFAQLVGVSQFYFGRDIVGVAELQAAGIDTKGPFGMALLDAEAHQIGIVYARAADTAAVTQAVSEFVQDRGATSRTETIDETGAVIIHLQGGSPTARGWVILRDGWVMAMITPLDDALALSHVRHLATTEPRRALATANGFTAALSGLEARAPERGSDSVRVFYNWGAMIQAQVASLDAETRAGDEDDYSVQQLKEARARGDRANIDYWEQVVRDNARWRKEARARRLAQRRFLAEFLAPMSALALQVDVEGNQLSITGFAAVPDEKALLGTLLHNEAPVPRIVHADAARPALMLHGYAGRDALVELVEALMRTEGSDVPTELRTELSNTLGLDLDQDVLPVFTGELGGRMHFASTPEGELIFDDEKSIEFTVLAGLTSAADGTALLEKVFGHPLLLAFARRDGDAARWTVNVPFYRALHAEVLSAPAPYLVLSTSEQAADRIASSAPVSFADGRPAPAGLEPLLARGDVAGLLVQDYAWMFAFLTGGTFYDSASSGLSDPYPDAPLSEASRLKLAEIESLKAQHESQIETIRSEQRRLTGQMLDTLGALGFTVRSESGGLGFDGGFFLGTGSLATTAGTVGELASGLETANQAIQAAWDQHWQQRATLEGEYQSLRYQDWTASQAANP